MGGERGFDERVVVTTAGQEVLEIESCVGVEESGPLEVGLAFEIEGAFAVGDVTGDDEEAEGDPEEEGVEAEEGAIVEEEAGPTYQGGKEACAGCDRRG